MPNALPLDDMLEKEWQREVRGLLQLFGYDLVYHTHNSRRSDEGFPDLVAVNAKRGRVIFLELKREKGSVTDKQARWLRALNMAGVEAYVVRPRNLEALANVLGGPQPEAMTSPMHVSSLAELDLERRKVTS